MSAGLALKCSCGVCSMNSVFAACPCDTATTVILSAVRRVAKIAQYVPEGALARTEGQVLVRKRMRVFLAPQAGRAAKRSAVLLHQCLQHSKFFGIVEYALCYCA